MSEALEKVRGLKFLPLFPLPLVLLPGELLPLHIFEPRYRQMLTDISQEKNLFGLSYFDARESGFTKPETGSFGCVAEISQAQTLPDGRSNILAMGVVRYRLENYTEAEEPYLVGEVSFFEDEEEDDSLLQPLADEVFSLFRRVMIAAQEQSGAPGKFPEIPQAAPQPLSFLVAAAFNLPTEIKYQFLKTRSALERLKRLREMLKASIVNIEESARIGKIAKNNGHGNKKIDV